MSRFKFITILSLVISMSIYSNLPIPPILEGESLELFMGNGELTLPIGTSRSMGFNEHYLGPTLRVSDKDLVKFRIKNNLDGENCRARV